MFVIPSESLNLFYYIKDNVMNFKGYEGEKLFWYALDPLDSTIFSEYYTIKNLEADYKITKPDRLFESDKSKSISEFGLVPLFSKTYKSMDRITIKKDKQFSINTGDYNFNIVFTTKEGNIYNPKLEYDPIAKYNISMPFIYKKGFCDLAIGQNMSTNTMNLNGFCIGYKNIIDLSAEDSRVEISLKCEIPNKNEININDIEFIVSIYSTTDLSNVTINLTTNNMIVFKPITVDKVIKGAVQSFKMVKDVSLYNNSNIFSKNNCLSINNHYIRPVIYINGKPQYVLSERLDYLKFEYPISVANRFYIDNDDLMEIVFSVINSDKKLPKIQLKIRSMKENKNNYDIFINFPQWYDGIDENYRLNYKFLASENINEILKPGFLLNFIGDE